jgi:hypothetical protein
MSAIQEGMGAVLLGGIQNHSLFQVLVGRDKLSQKEQGSPQRMMCLKEEPRVLQTLSQLQKLLS